MRYRRRHVYLEGEKKRLLGRFFSAGGYLAGDTFTAQAFSSAVPDLGSRALMVSTLVGNAMLKAFPTVEREISLQAVARASRAG